MNPPETTETPPALPRAALASALVLAALFCILAWLSQRYVYGGDPTERPTLLLVAITLSAGAAYLFALYRLLPARPSRALMLWVVGIGVIMRAVLFPSTPILEDDYYRYLLDGAVTANGFNPYRYTPNDIAMDPDLPAELIALGEAGSIERVNHASLGTIYPPVAQAAFALAHWISPWSLSAWRGVILVFDCATFLILLATLRILGRPAHWSAIYWWNPILVKEFVNAAHMDAVLLPFLAASIYFALRAMPLRCGVMLAAAAAVKVWPLLLAPLLFRGQGMETKRLVATLLLTGLVAGALYLPVVSARHLGDDSGFLAYGEGWEMNDAVFLAIYKGTESVAQQLQDTPSAHTIGLVARILVAALLGAFILGLSIRPPTDNADRCARVVWVVGALFMLSPTQFPWYYTWLVLFLALSPRPAFLLLSLTLPIYSLKFYYDALGDVNFFHNVLVWLEFGPVLILLAYELYRQRANAETPAHA